MKGRESHTSEVTTRTCEPSSHQEKAGPSQKAARTTERGPGGGKMRRKLLTSPGGSRHAWQWMVLPRATWRFLDLTGPVKTGHLRGRTCLGGG